MSAPVITRFGSCNCKRFAMQFASRPWIGFEFLEKFFLEFSQVSVVGTDTILPGTGFGPHGITLVDGSLFYSFSAERDETYGNITTVGVGVGYSQFASSRPTVESVLPLLSGPGSYVFTATQSPFTAGVTSPFISPFVLTSFSAGAEFEFEFRENYQHFHRVDIGFVTEGVTTPYTVTTRFAEELSVELMQDILTDDLSSVPFVYDDSLISNGRAGDGMARGGVREVFDNRFPFPAGVFTGSFISGFIERGYAQKIIGQTLNRQRFAPPYNPLAIFTRLKSFIPGRHGLRRNALEQFDGRSLAITDTYPCQTIEISGCDQIAGKIIDPPEDNFDGSLVDVLFEKHPCS